MVHRISLLLPEVFPDRLPLSFVVPPRQILRDVVSMLNANVFAAQNDTLADASGSQAK